jgi:integrase/recombinase XerD
MNGRIRAARIPPGRLLTFSPGGDRRRASNAGIETQIGCHTFRATGITDYLTNGGRIEVAQRMAGHSNAKTTGLYDRRNDDISIGEVERIGI